MYDLIIVGGGPAGLSCAQTLGSASEKEYMKGKKIGIIAYQKTSDLNAAVLNNLYGIPFNTKGKDLLAENLEQIKSFKSIEQLPQNPIIEINFKDGYYQVKTKNEEYTSKEVVLAIGHNNNMSKIKGLERYITKHTNSLPNVEKSALKNQNNLICEGLYSAGLSSNCASQAAIASGNGAYVAVQILTKWNNNKFDHHHDK